MRCGVLEAAAQWIFCKHPWLNEPRPGRNHTFLYPLVNCFGDCLGGPPTSLPLV